VTLVLLVSGPIAEHLIAQNIASQGTHALQMPAAPPGWTGPLATDDTWQPVYNGAQSAKMAYQHAHGKLTLFLAYYPHQQQGAEIINDRNSVSNTKLWKPRVTRDQQQLSGVRTVLDRVIESQSGEQRVLWYWYYVAGRYTVNKYEAKILQVIGVLLNRPQALVVIAVADSSLHEEQARALLNEFATGVDAALVRVASQRPELE
jgi:EpsI family protein